jgi:hypothetical protein
VYLPLKCSHFKPLYINCETPSKEFVTQQEMQPEVQFIRINVDKGARHELHKINKMKSNEKYAAITNSHIHS